MAKILAIVDSYNWALANRARSLRDHLKGHQWTIKHFNEVQDLSFDSFDVIYVLNWPITGYIQKKLSRKRKYRLVTTVCSHIGRPNAGKMRGIFDQYDAISTSNSFLQKEFKPVYRNKVFYTPFGVESSLFEPREAPSNYSNIFGWVGNHTRDVKRFKDIEKTFSELGDGFILKTATANDNLSREEMVDFYNSIGTLICFSTSEGTPNPVLEAAACGRSIISTPVGNAPDIVGNAGWIIKDRRELRDAIRIAPKTPKLLNHYGDKMRAKIEEVWDWSQASKRFIPFLGL